jgi:hypothetical protein
VTTREEMLSDRYGVPPSGRRPTVAALTAVLALTLTGWAVWVAWSHGTPDVESRLIGFEIIDERTATARVEVTVHREGAAVRCVIQALAEDHGRVGELTYEPTPGRNDLTIRTDREATAVRNVGCTTPDQRRAR